MIKLPFRKELIPAQPPLRLTGRTGVRHFKQKWTLWGQWMRLTIDIVLEDTCWMTLVAGVRFGNHRLVAEAMKALLERPRK